MSNQYVLDESSNTIMEEEQSLFDTRILIGLAATVGTICLLVLLSFAFKKKTHTLLDKLPTGKLAGTVDHFQGEAKDRLKLAQKAAKKASKKATKKALKANKKQFKAARKALRKKSKQVSDLI